MHYKVNTEGATRSQRFGGASQAVLVVKNTHANAGDIRSLGSISGLGRSPEGGHGNSLQILAGRIPWTEKSGGLQSIGHAELDMTEATSHTGMKVLGSFLLPLTPSQVAGKLHTILFLIYS